MDKFLEKYDDDKQLNEMYFEECGGAVADTYKPRGDLESDLGSRRACRFSRTWLGACSGLTNKTYGFKDGKPCLIVKLNRIVMYKPQPPLNDSKLLPAVQAKLVPNVIPIYCSNKREEDAGKIGDIEYHGIGEGFPLQYYPFYGKLLHPHYLQPLVAIQFTNLTWNEELRIECKAYGVNIKYSEKDRYQGRFDVKLTIKS